MPEDAYAAGVVVQAARTSVIEGCTAGGLSAANIEVLTGRQANTTSIHHRPLDSLPS